MDGGKGRRNGKARSARCQHFYICEIPTKDMLQTWAELDDRCSFCLVSMRIMLITVLVRYHFILDRLTDRFPQICE